MTDQQDQIPDDVYKEAIIEQGKQLELDIEDE